MFVASAIKTSTGVVYIDETPPEAGQVLTSVSNTLAKWQKPLSNLGINFGACRMVGSELIIEHSDESTITLVNGELIISLPNVSINTSTQSAIFNY